MKLIFVKRLMCLLIVSVLKVHNQQRAYRSMPGIGGVMPGMAGGLHRMRGDIREIHSNHQTKDERLNNMAAYIYVSTDSHDGIVEGRALFPADHKASYQWGWLIEKPALMVGAACSPLTTPHPKGKVITLIERGGCNFIDKALNGGTNMSIIYDTKPSGKLVSMDFGKPTLFSCIICSLFSLSCLVFLSWYGSSFFRYSVFCYEFQFIYYVFYGKYPLFFFHFIIYIIKCR